jgi:hypothetical protein
MGLWRTIGEKSPLRSMTGSQNVISPVYANYDFLGGKKVNWDYESW